MNEENKNQPPSETETPETVELTAEQYNALLDKLDEQDQLLQGQDPEEDDVSKLAIEGTQGQAAPAPEGEVDLEKLSNTELMNSLIDHVNEKGLVPVMTMVHEIKLEMDYDRFARKHDDADDHRDAMFQTMIDNPKLKMEQAYTLVKAGTPEPEPTATTERDATIRHLPPRKPPAHGEKPGAAVSTTEEGDPVTIDGAAEKAFEDTFGDKA